MYHSFAGERFFEIGEHLAKLQAKWLTVSYDRLSSKMLNSPEWLSLTWQFASITS